VGALGNLGVFSFQLSKNITAGEGGIIVTNDEALADFCWSYRNVGRLRGGQWNDHVRMGANYRLTEWQGAILLAQLERFPQHAELRERNAAYLTERLAAIDGIRPVRRDPRVTRHSNHLLIFRYDATAFRGMSREQFMAALGAEGIPCGSGYKPVNRSAAVKGGLQNLSKVLPDVPEPRDCPIAEHICDYEAVWLTQNMLLGTLEDMDSIVAAILKIKRASHS
jgi:dTDP-4-amino-4,6-dideoxygalactose transaminase